MPKSQADIIRDHINFKFDQNFDYSKKENRSLDVKDMQAQYKKLLTTNYTKLKAHHGKILKEVLLKRKIDPRTIGLSKKIPKFVPPSSMQANIQPKPQEVTAPPPSRTPMGYQQAAPPAGYPPQVAPQAEPFIKFTPIGTAATFNAFYMGLEAFFPYAKAMSAEQQQALGEMWTPIFNKYLKEKWEIILAIVATVGIFGGNIAQGRREQKKKEPQKKIEAPPTKSESKKEAPQETPATETLSEQEQKDKLESERIKKLDEKDKWEA